MNGNFARPKASDFVLIDINAEDMIAGISNARACDQTNVASSVDCEFHRLT